MTTDELFWLGVGMAGQFLFSVRVLSQWWASEKQGKCVVPAMYWVFGLCGGICLLAYGCYRRDPVILLGQICGSMVSSRNLMFVFQERRVRGIKTPKSMSIGKLRPILSEVTRGTR